MYTFYAVVFLTLGIIGFLISLFILFIHFYSNQLSQDYVAVVSRLVVDVIIHGILITSGILITLNYTCISFITLLPVIILQICFSLNNNIYILLAVQYPVKLLELPLRRRYLLMFIWLIISLLVIIPFVIVKNVTICDLKDSYRIIYIIIGVFAVLSNIIIIISICCVQNSKTKRELANEAKISILATLLPSVGCIAASWYDITEEAKDMVYALCYCLIGLYIISNNVFTLLNDDVQKAIKGISRRLRPQNFNNI
uniref:G_PROTEIN_RECEP_F1_2 domain-containing protein n=1 Tax=Strongyloides papillosus TaxID=174720 RepID=A0A0N5BLE2_STREA